MVDGDPPPGQVRGSPAPQMTQEGSSRSSNQPEANLTPEQERDVNLEVAPQSNSTESVVLNCSVAETSTPTKIPDDLVLHRYLCVAERDCTGATQRLEGADGLQRLQSFDLSDRE